MGCPNGVRAALEELPEIDHVEFEGESETFAVHPHPGKRIDRARVKETVEAWGRKRNEPYRVVFSQASEAKKPSLEERIVKKTSAFDLPKLGGGRLTYAPGQKPVLLVFWASWCDPCLTEAPHVERLHKQHGAAIDVLSVSIDDENDDDEVVEAVKKLSLSYPVALDPDAKLIKQLAGDANIPLTIVADARGDIIYHHANFEPGDEKLLAAAVTSAIAPSP